MLNGDGSGTRCDATARPGPWHLAVVLPAFNEEGLPEFLLELETHLRPVVSHLAFVVVDDLSTTPVAEVLRSRVTVLRSRVTVLRNEENLGHGPSALRAYDGGLATSADLVLHVDGDGQFLGEDVARLVGELGDADAVVGVRQSRTDPWYRTILTRCARLLVTMASGGVGDANTPLRLYRREALVALRSRVESSASVPHLQFSMIEGRAGLAVREVPVTHRLRRGTSAVGTMWRQGRVRLPLPSRRLIGFSVRAALEVVACMRRLDDGSYVVHPAPVGREAAA
jgi:undecaprenyl-phosphate 4-deoxy-4-formamido-L-arabinose transferase